MATFHRDMNEANRAAVLGPRMIRRVWAEVSRTPQASYQDLAVRLGIPKSTVHYALLRLRDAGYIEWEPGLRRARRVVVPFIALRKRA